jgi:hypothetical protein
MIEPACSPDPRRHFYRLATRGPRAAGGDAGDRLARRWIARRVSTVVAAFRQGLSETIEDFWAVDRYDRLTALAINLIGRKVDVIAAQATSRS